MRTLLIVADAYYGEAKLFYGAKFTVLQESFLIKDISIPTDCYKVLSPYSEIILIADSEDSTLAERVKSLAIKGSFGGTILAVACKDVSNIATLLVPENAANFSIVSKPYTTWPALPSENEKPTMAPFPLMALPEPMQAYCKAVSESTGTPIDYAAIPILGAMAGAIGASTKLMIKDGWEEYAALWLALCAEAGTTKTPVIKSCFKPIRGIQSELNKRYQMALKNFNDAKERAKKDPASETPTKPEPQYLFLVDTTQEGLIKTLADNPRGGCLVSDEITSWLGSHDKYTGKGNDRPFYLSLWSSTSFSSNRKGGGNLSVELPVLSVIGGLTPSSLPKLHGGQEDGFLSRFLIACPEKIKSYFNKTGISEAVQLAYDSFIRKLWELEPDHIDGESISPKRVVLSEDALAVFAAFANAIEDEKHSGDIPTILKGAWSKAPSQVGRIALVLHCCRQVSGEADDPHRLSADCMDAAILIIRYFLSHLSSMEGLFHVGVTKAEKVRIKVILWLKEHSSHPKYKGLPASWHKIRRGNVSRDITNRDGKIDDQALKQCLEGLEATGHVRLEYPQDKNGYEMKPLVHVNPRLTAGPERKGESA
jgi:hypothetical protein